MSDTGDPHIDYHRKYEHPEGETYTQRMRNSSRLVTHGIIALILLYIVLLMGGLIPTSRVDHENGDHHPEVPLPDDEGGPDADGAHQDSSHDAASALFHPPYIATIPFVLLLLAIAVLPLISFTEHWWHHNSNRFIVAATLGALTLFYYWKFHPGGVDNHFTHAPAAGEGWPTVWSVFCNAIFVEYVPFIILLFSLYAISGGINLRGDVPAHPATNCAFLGTGTILASFIGTTGAAMVLIRPLLATNLERKHKVHTVIFFIFMVCNCGGLLLPIGDPPLFLGYLRGVKFTWTLGLWPYWLGVNLALLIIYFFWDSIKYKQEAIPDIVKDEAQIRPLELNGKINIVFLVGVVLSVAFVVPDKPFTLPLLGQTSWFPPMFMREAIMLILVVLSLGFTHPHTRVLNRFDYIAITEVAALFCGIFLCMQVPIEILNIRGPSLGIDTPTKFFWATGVLSSFLDNAPTYVVFFETARTLPFDIGAPGVLELIGGGHIKELFLVPISLGAVLMGANTYIGNGPNFMVKAIAEQSGVKMPSFFGYMLYSSLILIPVFLLLTVLTINQHG